MGYARREHDQSRRSLHRRIPQEPRAIQLHIPNIRRYIQTQDYPTHDLTIGVDETAGPDVHRVEDRKIPVTAPAGEITIRIYSPEGVGPFPVHLNMHGGTSSPSPRIVTHTSFITLTSNTGGWVLGNLATEASFCRHTTNTARIKVIDIDYRLAPEHRFPTAIYDCWDAVKWVRAHAAELDIDASSVSIGGLSAGGHMAGVLAHFARDEGVELKLHLMVVPATDMRYCLKGLELGDAGCAYESVLKYHDAPWGPLGREKWFVKYWLGDDVGMYRCPYPDMTLSV